MKILKLFSLLFITTFILSGCSITLKSNTAGQRKGGFYLSSDSGKTWQQKALVSSVAAEKKSLSSVNINVMVLDPQDSSALYLGTAHKGLYYSYDSGQSWNYVEKLKTGTINSVAVDPLAKCVIYVGSLNRLFKSTDCSRSWEQIYFDSKLGEEILFTAVDPKKSTVVYMGLRRGEILISSDSGASWSSFKQFNGAIFKILISSADPNVMYVMVSGHGIYKTIDRGVNWIDLNPYVSSISKSPVVVDMFLHPNTANQIYALLKSGIVVSEDGGTTWSEIKTLTSKTTNDYLLSFAVNPNNPEELYYTTATTFNRSVDGGENWFAQKLLASRAKVTLRVNFDQPKTVYMAVQRFLEEQ